MTPEVTSLSLWQTAIKDEHDRNSNHFSLPLMKNDYNKSRIFMNRRVQS